MKPPKFIGVFPSQFPGWGRDDAPVFHRKSARTAAGEYVELDERQEKPCDMAFHPPNGGPCMSCRFNPMGVSGIDAAGNCWVLVRDYSVVSGDRFALRWVKFVVEVAE